MSFIDDKIYYFEFQYYLVFTFKLLRNEVATRCVPKLIFILILNYWRRYSVLVLFKLHIRFRQVDYLEVFDVLFKMFVFWFWNLLKLYFWELFANIIGNSFWKILHLFNKILIIYPRCYFLDLVSCFFECRFVIFV